MSALTEEKGAIEFAKAWNRLEPDGFLALLAPDARYASQWVFEELVGSESIADYLRDKMETVRSHSVNNPDSRVQVEVGRTDQESGSRFCALMIQGQPDTVKAVVHFDIDNNRIARYDLCVPELLGVERTGAYPI